MPTIDPAALGPAECYRLLISTIVPRPIAWVSTCTVDGVGNLAPYSFFNGITAAPPTLMLSIGKREPAKDTLTNIRATGEAVVHLPRPADIEAVHQCGGEYMAGIDEAEQLSLPMVASERVAPRRLVHAPVAFECRLHAEHVVHSATVVFLEIVLVHVDEAVCGEHAWPDPHKLVTLARLGERSYLASEAWDVVDQGKQDVPEDLRRPR